MPTAVTEGDDLAKFLERLPEAEARVAKSLSAGWVSGGGKLRCGNVAIRLLGGKTDSFTAATIHAARGTDAGRLELCRVILQHHGLDEDNWTHWTDEFADLAQHGFDVHAKYPTVALAEITPTELARLVTGLRDLAKMVSQ